MSHLYLVYRDAVPETSQIYISLGYSSFDWIGDESDTSERLRLDQKNMASESLCTKEY